MCQAYVLSSPPTIEQRKTRASKYIDIAPLDPQTFGLLVVLATKPALMAATVLDAPHCRAKVGGRLGDNELKEQSFPAA